MNPPLTHSFTFIGCSRSKSSVDRRGRTCKMKKFETVMRHDGRRSVRRDFDPWCYSYYYSSAGVKAQQHTHIFFYEKQEK
jgi:hypothetical protein